MSTSLELATIHELVCELGTRGDLVIAYQLHDERGPCLGLKTSGTIVTRLGLLELLARHIHQEADEIDDQVAK